MAKRDSNKNWLDRNLRGNGGRQGNSEALSNGTEQGEVCPLTGTHNCPSDPDATVNCPGC